jgi:DNA-binding response OmpR family regulator
MAAKLGADRTLMKPFQLSDLVAAVDAALVTRQTTHSGAAL